eukprot:TRINITY_DN2023_c0_g3_i1.p2 TRINITY_DN2023_c0_g3~~TRINITY_DN2023_c0_g3_i1.p2  ORF type:complete len:239 (+),score=17.83 TRINITY_DN2023_c0_g3_i1:158-874(+)
MNSLAYIGFSDTAVAVQIAAGHDYTCALFESTDWAGRRARCWGLGASGQLGTEDTASIGDGSGEMTALGYIEAPSKYGFVPDKIITNYATTCLMGVEEIFCFGSNVYGERGLDASGGAGAAPGTMGDNLDPARVTGTPPLPLPSSSPLLSLSLCLSLSVCLSLSLACGIPPRGSHRPSTGLCDILIILSYSCFTVSFSAICQSMSISEVFWVSMRPTQLWLQDQTSHCSSRLISGPLH